MKQKVFDVLGTLDISYQNFEHERVFTCAEAKGVDIPGLRVKSLLLRNKKATNFYMIVLRDHEQLEVNKLREVFADSKLSFASSEHMLEKIDVTPGSVSPLALINNSQNDIMLVFNHSLKDAEVGFHPIENDNTTVMHITDVEKYVSHVGNEFYYADIAKDEVYT